MKQTNFAKRLTEFLTVYLNGERGYAVNTIKSYRDTMLLLLVYMKSIHKKTAERIDFNDITQERILDFLQWLEQERGCHTSTRNVRLCAIHSFFKYLQYKAPEQLAQWQQILSIKTKKTPRPQKPYLRAKGLNLLLQQPDTKTQKGRRDLVLLSVLFDSGTRVQELIDLTPSCITFGKPTLLRVTGKGNKSRLIPVSGQVVSLLRAYMTENNLFQPFASEYPLFGSNRRQKFTRMGITSILKKYADRARKINPSLVPEKITPHAMRRSKAMILMNEGVDIVSIRDFWGTPQ